MSFSNLYSNGEQKSNKQHFAALVSLALADGKLEKSETKILERFADKLNIPQADMAEMIESNIPFSVAVPYSNTDRLERLYDLFRVVYSDNKVSSEEYALLKKYAIGLGYSEEKSEELLKKSNAIFSGNIDFEAYSYLINK